MWFTCSKKKKKKGKLLRASPEGEGVPSKCASQNERRGKRLELEIGRSHSGGLNGEKGLSYQDRSVAFP